jgi:hypothetical protein
MGNQHTLHLYKRIAGILTFNPLQSNNTVLTRLTDRESCSILHSPATVKSLWTEQVLKTDLMVAPIPGDLQCMAQFELSR